MAFAAVAPSSQVQAVVDSPQAVVDSPPLTHFLISDQTSRRLQRLLLGGADITDEKPGMPEVRLAPFLPQNARVDCDFSQICFGRDKVHFQPFLGRRFKGG